MQNYSFKIWVWCFILGVSFSMHNSTFLQVGRCTALIYWVRLCANIKSYGNIIWNIYYLYFLLIKENSKALLSYRNINRFYFTGLKEVKKKILLLGNIHKITMQCDDTIALRLKIRISFVWIQLKKIFFEEVLISQSLFFKWPTILV